MSRDFNKFFFDRLARTGKESSYEDWVAHCTDDSSRKYEAERAMCEEINKEKNRGEDEKI